MDVGMFRRTHPALTLPIGHEFDLVGTICIKLCGWGLRIYDNDSKPGVASAWLIHVMVNFLSPNNLLTSLNDPRWRYILRNHFASIFLASLFCLPTSKDEKEVVFFISKKSLPCWSLPSLGNLVFTSDENLSCTQGWGLMAGGNQRTLEGFCETKVFRQRVFMLNLDPLIYVMIYASHDLSPYRICDTVPDVTLVCLRVQTLNAWGLVPMQRLLSSALVPEKN